MHCHGECIVIAIEIQRFHSNNIGIYVFSIWIFVYNIVDKDIKKFKWKKRQPASKQCIQIHLDL